jgi:hypothetical protein
MLSAGEFRKTLIWLSLFSIAMGYMESSIVVYLREISYPEGFDFPLKVMEKGLALTEVIREAATMIILLAAGYIGGRNLAQRFAWFLYCFAVWDLLYYIFLKMLIGWPESLLTWDILFLIPVAWTGPVLAPLIVSLTMMLLALTLLHFSIGIELPIKIRFLEWCLLITGALVMILAFIWDYCSYYFRLAGSSGIKTGIMSQQVLYSYIPKAFNWILFMVAELILLAAVSLIWIRCRRKEP